MMNKDLASYSGDYVNHEANVGRAGQAEPVATGDLGGRTGGGPAPGGCGYTGRSGHPPIGRGLRCVAQLTGNYVDGKSAKHSGEMRIATGGEERDAPVSVFGIEFVPA